LDYSTNIIKPHTDKNKQVADNRQLKLMKNIFFYSSCCFGGPMNFL